MDNSSHSGQGWGFAPGAVLAGVGLTLILIAIMGWSATAHPAGTPPALGVIASLVGGVFTLGLGLLLWIRREGPLWPEVGILLLVVACGIFLVGRRPDANVTVAGVQVPVPADRMLGGTGPLAPGAWLDLLAAVPGAENTPQIVSLGALRVHGVVRADDHDTLLLAADPTVAPTLQAILLAEEVTLAYQLLPGTPTPTPWPTLTASPAATVALPTAAPGHAHVRLPFERLDLASSSLVTGPASLIFVKVSQLATPAAPASGTPEPIPSYSTESHQVNVVAFLDKLGNHGAYEKNKSTQVLLEVELEGMPDLARKLSEAKTIWLVPPLPARTPMP